MYAKDYHDRGTPESASRTYVTVEIDGVIVEKMLSSNQSRELMIGIKRDPVMLLAQVRARPLATLERDQFLKLMEAEFDTPAFRALKAHHAHSGPIHV